MPSSQTTATTARRRRAGPGRTGERQGHGRQAGSSHAAADQAEPGSSSPPRAASGREVSRTGRCGASAAGTPSTARRGWARTPGLPRARTRSRPPPPGPAGRPSGTAARPGLAAERGHGGERQGQRGAEQPAAADSRSGREQEGVAAVIPAGGPAARSCPAAGPALTPRGGPTPRSEWPGRPAAAAGATCGAVQHVCLDGVPGASPGAPRT